MNNSDIRNPCFGRLAHKLVLAAAAVPLVLAAAISNSRANSPCGDFGECKVLIEINASDGDIGFHFLMDGDDLIEASLVDPDGANVFEVKTYGPLRDQKLAERFSESAEPLCWPGPEADPDDEFLMLEEFLGRWTAGTYVFTGKGDDGEKFEGDTELTHNLPAAPADLSFDDGVISWGAGVDLGKCANNNEQGDEDTPPSDPTLEELIEADVIPDPEGVEVAAWEVVLEPDVDNDSTRSLVFLVRVAGDISLKKVTVPADYLASLPRDTPVKVEVGALGVDGNATFSEEDGFCINEVEGCQDEE